MNWQPSPQCVHPRQPPVLPSFSQLVNTLAQPSSPDTSKSLHRADHSYPRHTHSAPFSRSPVDSTFSRIESSLSPRKPSFQTATEPSQHSIFRAPLHRSDYSKNLSELEHDAAIVSHPDPLADFKYGLETETNDFPPRLAKRHRKDRNLPLHPQFTRDGNPRKRLAQACLRCRTQKIKCRLNGSACVQCTKQGVECRFAARTHQSRASNQQASGLACPRIREKVIEIDALRDQSPIDRRSKESTESERVPSDIAQSGKVPRLPRDLDFLLAVETANSSVRVSKESGKEADSTKSEQTWTVPAFDDLSINIDPYLFDASLTKHYVGHYFDSVNRNPYYLLPKAPFLDWLASPNKTATENMLLYAIMAAGAIFSKHRYQNTHQLMFTCIVGDGLNTYNGIFEMPVVHTLLILSTLSGHGGDLESASNDSISAIRCAYGLQLNQEAAYPASNRNCPYLTDAHVAECSRRTFWLAYIRSSMWSVFSGNSSKIPVLQGNLKMPCSDSEYEAGISSQMPLISLSPTARRCVSLSQGDPKTFSHIALLVQAAAIILDADQQCTQGTPQNGETTRPRLPMDEYIRRWRQRREASLLSSPDGLPVELKVMDKCIWLIAHRYMQQNMVDQTHAIDHFLQARHRAMQLLDQLYRWQRDATQSAASGISMDPFMSCAIFMAFDTVTAASVISDVLDRREKSGSGRPTFMSLATHAITIASNTAEYSKLAETQLQAMKRRLAAIMSQSNTTEAWKKRGFYFSEPLYKVLFGCQDLIYDISKSDIAVALGLGGNEDDMLEMKVPSDE